jgi:hypothetical protein
LHSNAQTGSFSFEEASSCRTFFIFAVLLFMPWTVTSQNRTATLLVVSYNAVGSSPVYYYVFCPNLVLAFRYINEMF